MNKFTYEHYSGLPYQHKAFIIETYKSFITTCIYIEIYFPNEDYYYTLIKKDETIAEIIIYSIKNNICNCHNSLVSIDKDIIEFFALSAFENFPTLKKIKFSASYSRFDDLKKSFLLSTANDYVLNLPATLDDYYSILGATTRRHLKNYKARLLKDNQNVRFITQSGTEIEKDVIDKIVQLSYNRMKSKGIVPGKNQKDTIDFFNYSQYFGSVTYIEIDGIIVAGSISYILNNRFFLYMIAHDNNFSKYNPGQLCIIYSIQEAIQLKLKTFHFLWGDNDYKMRLKAEPQLLSTYIFYKSYSMDFFSSKLKAYFSRQLLSIRQSKHLKPIRDAIKNFRKRNLY